MKTAPWRAHGKATHADRTSEARTRDDYEESLGEESEKRVYCAVLRTELWLHVGAEKGRGSVRGRQRASSCRGSGSGAAGGCHDYCNTFTRTRAAHV
jgi:hypothetical protein